MKNTTRKWIRAGIEVLIHGSTSAITAAITATSVAPGQFPFFSPNFFKMLGAGFVTNGALRFFQWWSNNPLPPESDSAPPIVQPPAISLNPLSKVQSIPPTGP